MDILGANIRTYCSLYHIGFKLGDALLVFLGHVPLLYQNRAANNMGPPVWWENLYALSLISALISPLKRFTTIQDT